MSENKPIGKDWELYYIDLGEDDWEETTMTKLYRLLTVDRILCMYEDEAIALIKERGVAETDEEARDLRNKIIRIVLGEDD